MAVARCRYHICSLLFFLVCCSARTEPKRECLPSFKTHPERFDICKIETCVVFRIEKPFVFLDPRMTSTDHESPFRCRVRKKLYPGLKGIFFSTLDELDTLTDAWCMWVGPNCPYDGLVTFLQDTAEAGPHQFLAGGLLFNLEYRMRNTTIPTVPLVHDQIQIIGQNVSAQMNIRSAWKVVLSPFTDAAWFFLVCCLIAMAILRSVISVMFGRRRLIRHIFGEYNTETSEDVRRFNRYWMNGLRLFFIIAILYYELALVNEFLEQREKMPITQLDPTNFARIRNTTEDYMFWKLMPNALPGAGLLVDDSDELYNKLTEKNGYHLTVSYRLFNKHFFQKNSTLCRDFQVYDTDQRLPTLDGVWFMSSNIPPATRGRINREILMLRENGRMFELIETEVHPQEPNCVPVVGMHVAVIALPMLVLPGVIFILLICCMIGRFAFIQIYPKGVPVAPPAPPSAEEEYDSMAAAEMDYRYQVDDSSNRIVLARDFDPVGESSLRHGGY